MRDGQDGQTDAQVPSVPPVIPDLTTQPAPEAPPPPAPMTPQQAGVWPVPTETAALLRDIDGTCGGLLAKIGSLEVEYLAAKYAAMDELKSKRGLFKSLVDEAAKKAGLDIDKSRWNLDTRTMTLIRTS